MALSQAFQRDANFVPVQTFGFSVSTPQVFSGSNTTVATPLFHVVGSVKVLQLFAVVTTVLGTTHTAAAYRLNDQSAQVDITAAAGTDLSSFKVGSLLVKNALKGVAIGTIDATNAAIAEPAATLPFYFVPFMLTKKLNATTDIEYVYTTTDTPTTGAVTHFVYFQPISADGNLVVI